MARTPEKKMRILFASMCLFEAIIALGVVSFVLDRCEMAWKRFHVSAPSVPARLFEIRACLREQWLLAIVVYTLLLGGILTPYCVAKRTATLRRTLFVEFILIGTAALMTMYLCVPGLVRYTVQ